PATRRVERGGAGARPARLLRLPGDAVLPDVGRGGRRRDHLDAARAAAGGLAGVSERARVIGTSVPKRDGADKVTGRTRYLHDLELPRLAHGQTLRSRLPDAGLVRVGTRGGAALQGVPDIGPGVGAGEHA